VIDGEVLGRRTQQQFATAILSEPGAPFNAAAIYTNLLACGHANAAIGFLIETGRAATIGGYHVYTTVLLALAMISVAGVANAKTIYEPPVQELPIVDTDMPTHGPHQVAITDEYGFRYDRWVSLLKSPTGQGIGLLTKRATDAS
jgi:hypothetical protein